jgi:tape measure domain-containing protein
MATENLRYNILLNDQLSAGLAKIEARLARLEAGFTRANKSADSMNGFMKGSFILGAANAIEAIVSKFGALAVQTIQAAGALQANDNAIRVASGSTTEYNRNLAFLDKLTSKMPVSIEAASEGYKMWSGAIMETSLAGERGRKIFEQVSTASASMGISADNTKGIFLALGQMVSKGTVQSEELKGQLGERLPGAFLLAAKAMGVTTEELGNLLKEGRVTAEELLPRLGDELEKRFAPGLAKANESINASTTRLENLRTRGIVSMTPALSKFMFHFATAMESTSNWLGLAWEKSEPVKDAFSSLFSTFGQTASALVDVFSALGDMLGGVGEGIPILKIFGTMIMNALVPIHLFSASLQLTYRVLETLYLLFDRLFEGDFEGMGDVLTSQAGKIEDVFTNTFNNIADGYKNIWTEEGPKALEGDSFARGDTSKGGGGGLKGLLSGSLFDEETGPKLLGGGKDKKKGKLEKAADSISGSAPRNITIQINSLIGQNNNYISNVQNPMNDLKTFIDKLKQALQQEIVDVNIQML